MRLPKRIEKIIWSYFTLGVDRYHESYFRVVFLSMSITAIQVWNFVFLINGSLISDFQLVVNSLINIFISNMFMFWLQWKKKYWPVANARIALMLISQARLYFFAESLTDASIVGGLFIPISGFFFTGKKGGFIWTGLFILTLLGPSITNSIGLTSIPTEPLVIQSFVYLSAMIAFTAYMYEVMNEFHRDFLEEKKRLLRKKNKLLKKKNKLLRESRNIISKEKEKLKVILQSIGDGVVVFDEKKRIILVNSMAQKLSGYDAQELIGTEINDKLKFTYEKSGRDQIGFLNRVYRTGKICSMSRNTMLVKKNEKLLPVADSAAPIKNTNGKVIGSVIVFRDVTKEREIDKMKTEFLSVASHQLRTPIATIRWVLELLMEDADNFDKQQKEYLYEINQQAGDMRALVEDLLNISRIETGRKFAISKMQTDIVNVIDIQIKAQKLSAAKKKIKIITNLPKENIINIDSQKIGQVLHNLISNAIKYTPKNGKVEIGMKKGRDFDTYYVKDNGIGIPESEHDKMFKKFFRATNAKEIQGNGLGMYIVKAVVEGHKGKVWFDSKENKGTTFYFTLPNKLPPKKKN